MMRKFFGYALISLVVLGSALLAWQYVKHGGGSPEPRWNGGEIRVGYSSEPPYSFRTAYGTVTGQGPELAKIVLNRLGIGPIRWVLLDFSQAIPNLRAGNIDMIANGLFITPSRAAVIAFSLPYSQVAQGLLVRSGNPKQLHGYADVVARNDIRVAVLDGSIEQQILTRLGVAPSRQFVVPQPLDGLAAVRQNHADCLALSGPTVTWLAGEAPTDVAVAMPFHAAASVIPPEMSAFGFRRGDAALRKAVDGVLHRYVGTPDYMVRMQHFGFGPESMPPWAQKK